MKISVQQDVLARGLGVVGRAIATRSPMPITSNVLISSDDDRVRLSATNLEITITCWIGATIEEAGATTVPARLLTDFVNSLPPEPVAMRLNERSQTLNVRGGAFEANVKGIDADEFPPVATVPEVPTAAVDPELFAEAIGQVAFAAGTDDSRPVLAGVLLSFRDDQLTLAAADGFRLAVRDMRVDRAAAFGDLIVPARTMHEFSRIIGEQEDPIEIAVTPTRNQVLFRLKNVQLISRLIEGNFPNFRQIIPTRRATRVVVDAKEFLNATKIASFFARDAANIVRLQITPGQDLTPGKLTVAATAAEVGDAIGGIAAVVDGEPGQIAFNGKYLADVLGVLKAPQVALETASPSSPGVLRPVGSEEYVHVIMPMHVSR